MNSATLQFQLAQFVAYPDPDPGIKTIGTISAIITAFGTLSNSIILFSVAANRTNITSYSIFIITLNTLDWLLCISTFIFNTLNLMHRGWATGIIGCTITHYISYGAAGGSLLIIACIALERYMAVCWRKPLSTKSSLRIVLITSLYGPLISTLVPLPFGAISDSYALVPSMLTCLPYWAGKGTGAQVLAINAVIVILLSLFANAYMNIAVVAFYMKRISMTNTRISDQERQLLKRAIILSVAYFVMWGPYGFMVLYSVTTHKQPHWFLDGMVSILVYLNSATNPILLYICDGRARKNVQSFLGFGKIEQSPTGEYVFSSQTYE
jgi:hypothetical protein